MDIVPSQTKRLNLRRFVFGAAGGLVLAWLARSGRIPLLPTFEELPSIFYYVIYSGLGGVIVGVGLRSDFITRANKRKV